VSSETGGGLPGTLLPVFLLSILVSSLDCVVLYHTGRTCKKPQHQAVGNKCYTTVSFKFQLAIFRYLCRLFAVCVLMLHLTEFYILAGLLLTLANIGEVGMAVSSPLFFSFELFFSLYVGRPRIYFSVMHLMKWVLLVLELKALRQGACGYGSKSIESRDMLSPL